MACYYPLNAWRKKDGENWKTGKHGLTFDYSKSVPYSMGYTQLSHQHLGLIKIPCGQCIGCRLEKSRQWAIRCVHEATLHEENSFITLTYAPEHLKSDSLNKRDMQLFLKRLRKKLGIKIRFFQCGEYGDEKNRPHHHALIFGYQFPDLKFHSPNRGFPLYTSNILENIWGLGLCSVGHVTFQSAAYIARYTLKKITGQESQNYYGNRLPPYITMSRRPGIAREWYNQFSSDIYPQDYLIIKDGLKCRPTKYYDKLYDIEHPKEFEKIKLKRKQNLKENEDNNTEERLEIREYIQLKKAQQLVRSYESE